MKRFNDIKSRDELADFLGIRKQTLTFTLYKLGTDSLYTTFTIPKKNGDNRTIHAPINPLKYIQKSLAEELDKYQKKISRENNLNSNISHGFISERSIITNAQIHRNKRYVLNVDLNDFFSSFHFGRVKGYFEKNKYFKLPKEVATIIAQLTCYNGVLPQGAPTSPIITNFICDILDYKVLKIAKKYKADYTRYADDLTFSTNNKYFKNDCENFLKELNDVIIHSGLEINDSKTRLQYKYSKQEVTGLSVNKKLNVDRIFRKKTRAMAHRLYSNGKFEIDGVEGTIEQLEGRFSFINQLDYYNNIENKNDKKGNKLTLHQLNSREKDYQKFLFYKYFITNPKPLIITEGKTDVRYLKAAIKKHATEYPQLISGLQYKEPFEIAFLNKTSRLRYFMGLQIDGADTFNNIFNFYAGKNNFPNYWDSLVTKFGITPTHPVILIMDNEENQKKPLSKFLNYISNSASKIDANYKQTLNSTLFINIIGNLYLLITPKVEDMKDSEIEDLFDKEVLSMRISGKSFSRNSSSNNKYYGKEIFSKYILNNYHTIDFNNFKPMLESLTSIVDTFPLKPDVT